MPNLLYRNTLSPTLPISTSVKGSPLTYDEIDGNFKSLSDSIDLKSNINSPSFTGLVSGNTGFNLNYSGGFTYSYVNNQCNTGSTSGHGFINLPDVPTSVTASYFGFRSIAYTANNTALTTYNHYYAEFGALGSSSNVTNNYGFRVDSDMTFATNNYGIFSNIAAGTGRWNFYANGTADNYFAGKVGIGGIFSTTRFTLAGSYDSSASVWGADIEPSISGTSITTATYVGSYATVAASATTNNLYNFLAGANTWGSGASVTSQYGFFASSGLTQATNNYGFYGNLSSAANRWNFYAAGTAPNFFAGMTWFGRAIREARLALPANDIDCSLASVYTKTISGATTLTLSNIATSGYITSFILELTNGGSATITWWSGIKWAGGTVPTLTASGVDILSFYTHDGGTTWRAAVIAKDSK